MQSGGSAGKRWHLRDRSKLLRRWHPSWFATNQSPNCLKLTRKIDALSLPIRAAANFGRPLGEVRSPPFREGGLAARQSCGERLDSRTGRVLLHVPSNRVGILRLWKSLQDDWSSYPPIGTDHTTTRWSPSRRVTRSRSRYSSSGIAYLRETPARSLNCGTASRCPL